MSRVSKRRARRARLGAAVPLVLATGLAGCDSPTRPAEPASAPMVVAPALSAALSATVADARERIVPGLVQEATPDALGAALADVANALSAGDAGALRGALGRADAALAAINPDEAAASAADLDAVRLVIAQARTTLQQ